jgi:predicted nuclease of predicted toxin-antitoxin system
MRFKIDENLPIEVAELLRANMHDSMTIFDQNMVGELDSKIASVCKSEERALITLDLDFSHIRIYPPSEYPGIIILRPRTQSKPDVLALVHKLIPLLDGSERLMGNLWIVQENRIRISEGMRREEKN